MHAGHRICVAGAVDDIHVAAEDLYWEQDDDEAQDALDAQVDVWHARRAERVASGEFISAVYQASCLPCGERFVAHRADVLKRFDAVAVADATVAMFVDRWTPPDRPLEADWLMSIVDPGEPFVGELAQFLGRHRGAPRSLFRRARTHEIIAGLDVPA